MAKTRKQTAPPTTAEERARKIAEQAYYLAEQRQFAPGGELEDWLAAERAIDAQATQINAT